MNYTVVWLPDAEQELADIWLNASDPDLVTQVAHEIDQQLLRDPLNAGESRVGSQRILHVKPLAVGFDVIQDDLRVEVFHVWTY